MSNKYVFPQDIQIEEGLGRGGFYRGGGLTKLEWFTGMALQGILASGKELPTDARDVGKLAVISAQATLAVLIAGASSGSTSPEPEGK